MKDAGEFLYEGSIREWREWLDKIAVEYGEEAVLECDPDDSFVGVSCTILDERRRSKSRVVMPRINGVPFRCDCGGNVFTEYKPLKYQCNSCRACYEGEK